MSLVLFFGQDVVPNASQNLEVCPGRGITYIFGDAKHAPTMIAYAEIDS